MADNPAGTREKRVEDRLEECIALLSPAEDEKQLSNLPTSVHVDYF